MTIVIIANLVFAYFVLAAIVGGLAWTILTEQPHHLKGRRPGLSGRGPVRAVAVPEPAHS